MRGVYGSGSVATVAAGPYIGRVFETETVTRNVEAARGGSGSLTMVIGEPGIGKSRLAREAAAAARAAGLTVYWGRCWESGGQPAYWPWVQVVRGLLRGSSPEQLALRLGPMGGDVARLVPEIATICPELPALPPLQGPQSRFRLLEAVAGFLTASAEESPLLLILDDLHAADRSSLELLDFISRQVEEYPIAIIGAYRDTDARVAGLSELLCRAERVADVLRLSPLGRGEVEALVASFRDGAADGADLDRIYAASEGNPLFIEELLRRGNLASVPDGIAAVIRERLAMLPEPTRALLAEASVAGRELQGALLADALQRPASDVQAALESAAAQAVLSPAGQGDYRFAHILLRETLYRDLSPPRRFALHAAFARAIAARPSPSASSLAELAHHFDQAGPEAAAEAVDAYRRAAAGAVNQLAFADGADLLGRALEIQATYAPDDDRQRCGLLLDRGEALIKAGAVEAGQRACVDAAALARTLNSSELLARAALVLGSVFSLGRTDPRLVNLLRESLAALADDEMRLRALCEARLAAALQPAKDPSVPMAMAREAIARARATGDDRTLLDTIRSASSALMDFEHPRVRAEINREHVELARRLGDSTEVLRGCARLAFDYAEAGDVFSADAVVEAYGQEAARVGHPYYEWQAAALRAMRLIMRGELQAAAVMHARALALAPDTGDPYTVAYTYFQALGLARASYDDARLRQLLVHPVIVGALNAGPDYIGRLVFGGFCAHLEDEAEVRRLFGDDPSRGLDGLRDLHPLTSGAEVAFALGDATLAEAVLHELAANTDRNTSWGLMCMICDTPIERAVALCEAARGDLPAARRHFEAAAKRAEGMSAPGMLARIHYEHAVAIERLGGDAATRAALLDEAEALARAIGADGLVRRIDARRTGAEVSPAPAQPAATVVVARDGDAWVLQFRGDSTRIKDSRGMQILARLIAEPGREWHVLELGSRAPVVDTGDSGAALDPEAIAAYRGRVRELRADIEEAESWNDAGRADRARAELEMLTAELSRAVGLGGRTRRDQNAAERARVNVRKRVQHALRGIEACNAELAHYLQRTVRTGAFCAFEPV